MLTCINLELCTILCTNPSKSKSQVLCCSPKSKAQSSCWLIRNCIWSHMPYLWWRTLICPHPRLEFPALDAVVSPGQLLVEPHSQICSPPFSLRAPNWWKKVRQTLLALTDTTWPRFLCGFSIRAVNFYGHALHRQQAPVRLHHLLRFVEHAFIS